MKRSFGGVTQVKDMANNDQETLNNLVATIEAVAAGDAFQSDDDLDNTQVVTAEMLDGAVLHLSDGQSINVVQMTGSLEDGIDVVQVETELGDVSSVEEICAIDVDIDEQNHILSETGAHVIVQTEDEKIPSRSQKSRSAARRDDESSGLFPSVPFSFPGQAFDVQCQKLILNVWDFFKRLKKNPDLLDAIKTPQERAAAALHISAATIGKIGKNFKKNGTLEKPGKKRIRVRPVVDSVDAEQEQVIRDVIEEYRENKITPTIHLVLNECRERINYTGGATSFRRILKRMGYKGLSPKIGTWPGPRIKSVTSTSTSSSTPSLPSKPAKSKAGFVSQKPNRSIPSKFENSYISIPVKSSEVLSPLKNRSKPSSSPSPSKEAASIITTPIKQETFIDWDNNSSKILSSLFGGNVLQLGSVGGKRESFTITPQALSALVSAGTKSMDSQPQTIQVVGPDNNTVQQIQIFYGNGMD